MPDSAQIRAFVLSLFLLAIGVTGYFLTNRGLPIFYISAHLGALGLLGLFGTLAGILARQKRLSFWVAFFLGTLLPIEAGLIAVLIFYLGTDRQLYCGGASSLAVAFLIIILYFIVKKRPQKDASG